MIVYQTASKPSLISTSLQPSANQLCNSSPNLVILPVDLSQSKLWCLYVLVSLYSSSAQNSSVVGWGLVCLWTKGNLYSRGQFFFFCCIAHLVLEVIYQGLALEQDRVTSRLPAVGYFCRDPPVYTCSGCVTFVPIVLGNSFFFSNAPASALGSYALYMQLPVCYTDSSRH